MKFEASNKAQNLLYKLDTMKRRDNDEQEAKKTQASTPS
jgi:hypothetical protein